MNTEHAPSDSPQPRQRILVVSGDPQLRERLHDLLTRHGYAVTTILAGQVALDVLQRQWPDLIVANSLAHRYGGMALMTHVRSFDHELPIILLGTLDDALMGTDTIRDVQAFLPSDASEEDLLAAISRWLTPARSLTPIDYPGPILLVDDEPELLSNLEGFLTPRGCTILKATSGEEALAQIVSGHPTLVLLDIKMPGMDGLVTLKKLKAQWPELPVVVATAVGDRESMVQAYSLGAFEYLTKPYNLRNLEDQLLYLKHHPTKT